MSYNKRRTYGENPSFKRFAGKYQTVKKLGEGAFGEIYMVINVQNGEQLAIKLEKKTCKFPQVLREARLIKALSLSRRSVGIPKIKYAGSEQGYNLMVMDLLGPSLEALFNDCGRTFTLQTTLMLADQLIRRVEYIHSKSFIHRDIKPDNFLMGINKKSHIVYVVDFGLSKKYRDSKHNHIKYRDDKHLTGTARYASINNHLGIEQSRRDDLESIGYILLYFLKGKLPWQGLKAKTKNEKYNRICEKKTSIGIKSLCKDLPSQFVTYLNYCRSIGFEDKPDYQYLRQMFRQLFVSKHYVMDFVYDWVLMKRQSAPEETSASYGSGSGKPAAM